MNLLIPLKMFYNKGVDSRRVIPFDDKAGCSHTCLPLLQCGNSRWESGMNCKNCGKPLIGQWQKVMCSQLCVVRYYSRSPEGRQQRRKTGKLLWRNEAYRQKRTIEYHNRIGAANPNWKGGPKTPHDSKLWQMISALVRKRDNYTCQDCGKKNGPLYAHHINLNSTDHRVENGVTVCPKCHARRHNASAQVKEYWKRKKEGASNALSSL